MKDSNTSQINLLIVSLSIIHYVIKKTRIRWQWSKKSIYSNTENPCD